MTPDKSPTQTYFLVSGEVEYEVQESSPQRMRVNGIYVSKESRIGAKGLGQIQTQLQMQFHAKYSRTHPRAPNITDVVIFAISPLGAFTPEEFHAEALQ